jgi:hypothetical protein
MKQSNRRKEERFNSVIEYDNGYNMRTQLCTTTEACRKRSQHIPFVIAIAVNDVLGKAQEPRAGIRSVVMMPFWKFGRFDDFRRLLTYPRSRKAPLV